jgi:hypothetical protein
MPSSPINGFVNDSRMAMLNLLRLGSRFVSLMDISLHANFGTGIATTDLYLLAAHVLIDNQYAKYSLGGGSIGQIGIEINKMTLPA